MTLSQLLLGIGLVPLALAAAVQPAAAQQAGGAGIYTVTYFEAAAPSGAQAAGLARQLAGASRKEPGNAGFEAFQEIGRPSRFALFEAWHDKAAADAHDKGTVAAASRDKLEPLLVGPFEVRSFSGFSVAGPTAPSGSRAVYVITHVDVFPTGKDQAATLVTALAEAGRKLPGNLWFDVLQMVGHANHFTLVGGWRNRRAFDDSLMAAATRDFRHGITPIEGALFDERLYRIVR